MPAELTESGVAAARTRVRPTPVGTAVLLALIGAIFLSASSRIAVGFFVPIVVVMAVDAFLSVRVIERRRVSVLPVRTIAGSPEPITFRVQADSGDEEIRIRLNQLSPLDPAPDEVTLPTDGTPITISAPDGHATAAEHIRYQLSASILGLATARRWEARSVPMLYRAPSPAYSDLPVPNALDEVSRLRPYVPGDRLGRVSWPVTARTGQLHVRSPGPGDSEVVVVLNLAPELRPVGNEVGFGQRFAQQPGESGEAVAGGTPEQQLTYGLHSVLAAAASVVGSLREQGQDVRLISTELDDRYFDALRDAALGDPSVPEKAERQIGDDWTNSVDGKRIDRIRNDLVIDDHELVRRLACADIGPHIDWPDGPYIDISFAGVRAVNT